MQKPESVYCAAASVSERDILRTLGPLSRGGRWVMIFIALVFAWGVVAYIHQLRHGLVVTAMTDYFSWGIYIINFVFFIGISMAGSLISAILRLTGAEWRRPITRMAEGITVFALIGAAIMIVVDMGRPDRFFHVLRYARMQSPILWDVFSLSTYLAGSALFLYLPLIPDLAVLRNQGGRFSPWRRWLYTKLALNWTGTPEQHRRLERAITVMSIIIIPVAVSIHTVTAWLFGLTLRPGWHSTIIGPDFVVGALYSGIAAVLTVMAYLRRKFRLQAYVTPEHFKKLGLLLLVSCVAYIYFVVNEYIGAIYTREATERELVEAIFRGPYAAQFWTMAGIGLFVPGVLLALPWTRTVSGIVTASVLANIGMWLKRYVIVVPTLSSPFLPVDLPTEQTFAYVPTWVEWSITAGVLAGFCLFYCGFSKVFPVISIWETQIAPAPSDAGKFAEGKGENSVAAPVASVQLLALGLDLALLFSGSPSARAADTTPASKPAVSLKVSTEESKKVIVATVTLNGKPVEGAKVAFLVRRTFGQIVLGQEDTLDDGTAAVSFPSDLPGGTNGALNVAAEIKSPAQHAGARAEADFEGGLRIRVESEPFPRALWAPRAPVELLLVLLTILGAVWGTYAYVVVQLVQLKKGTKP